MLTDTSANPYNLIEQVEQAKTSQEIASLIDKLVELGPVSVTALLEKMPKPVHARLHFIGAKVFARIGYPKNREALDFMVSDASNINSSAYEISRKALLSIGRPVLPNISHALKFYRRDNESYKFEIESLEEIGNLIQK